MDKSAYVALYFSSPGTTRVRVFGVEGSDGWGEHITDYAQFPDPVYLPLGKTKVTYCCPNETGYSYDIGEVTLLSLGRHFLFCTASGKLAVGKSGPGA